MQSMRFIGLEQGSLTDFANCCVGWIVEVAPDGVPIIDYQGNELGPVQARSIVVVPEAAEAELAGHQVLLVFEDKDFWRPIIVGLVHNKILSPKTDADGKSMRIEKEEEILLVCGKSSIKLKSDGKVIIKGTDIVSRSSGANKIKGASVSIN